MSLVATILGCGSSGGVPRVGYGWGVCDPAEPRNRRRRCALLVERNAASGKTTVVIDTGPDLREQLLDSAVQRVDAVFYTHEHADHTHGIDDLRVVAINQRAQVPVHAEPRTRQLLLARFGYCFETPPGSDYPPFLDMRMLEPGRAVTVTGAGGPITLLPILQHHGLITSLGFRVGDLVYSADIDGLPEPSCQAFAGARTWVVDALRPAPHPSHWSVEQALEAASCLGIEHTILTNMHTDLDYRTLAAALPAGVEPAYDGMRIDIEDQAAIPA